MNGQFRQPTDVAWDRDGNIFISDGYVNSRVAKIDKNGDWVRQWGEPGEAPGQFNTPHSIASDLAGNIYVADRGNRRIQVACPSENELYVAELLNWRAQKLMLHPVNGGSTTAPAQ